MFGGGSNYIAGKDLTQKFWGKYTVIYINYFYSNRLIGIVGRVFANGPGDLSSVPGRVISKTLKMVLDASLLIPQQYNVRIKVKVEKSMERSHTLPYTSV